LRAFTSTLWLPKGGNEPDEYEDAFYPEHSGWAGLDQIRAGVADGASEGFLSGPWARILLDTYCRATTDFDVEQLVGDARADWQAWLDNYLKTRTREGRPVQWFEERGLNAPTAATLAVVDLRAPARSQRRWTGIAFGDSCVFHVRAGDLKQAFPVEKAEDFDISPVVVTSRAAGRQAIDEQCSMAGGIWQPGDRFFLASDAIAQWLLAQHETGRKGLWSVMGNIVLHQATLDFEELIVSLRSTREIRNDDVTLMVIHVE
jgi:hypothetical protein